MGFAHRDLVAVTDELDDEIMGARDVHGLR